MTTTFKPRRLVYRQAGQQLQTIGDLFIAALLHTRPEGESVMRFMERIFHVETRFIFQCVVTARFEASGKLFAPGQRLFVRHDTTRPELYEVERVADAGPVLAVGREDWMRNRHCLRVVDKNKDGAEKVF